MHILPTGALTPTSAHLQKSRPHLSTVTALRFFPSSRVLLTAGSDFALSVLAAEPLSLDLDVDAPAPVPMVAPVRTLRGHTRAVTATAIVGRGQTVLSASKDGSVRVWDVAAGAQTRSFRAAGFAPVLGMAFGERADAVLSPDATGDGVTAAAAAAEGVAAHELAWCALGDGSLEAFDFRSGQSVFWSKEKGSATTAVAYSAKHSLVATGSAKGVVQLWDTRTLAQPVVAFTRSGASVEELSFLEVAPEAFAEESGGSGEVEVGLAITSEDGLPWVASVRPEGPHVVAELVGADCERVGSLRVRGNGPWNAINGGAEVWIAADDGIVRRH